MSIKPTLTVSLFMAISLVMLICGCNKSIFWGPPPCLPPEYYNCTEADPQTMANSYFSTTDINALNIRFTGSIFVFNNVEVSKRTFLGLDEGYIWVDRIKCYLVNPEMMDKFKPGDKIQVVGRNEGRYTRTLPGMIFKDCYVLPAGLLALPADPNSRPFTAGY